MNEITSIVQADHVVLRVDDCSESDVMVKTSVDSHDGAGDVVEGEEEEVSAVGLGSGSNDDSAIYIAILCIVLFVGAMIGVASYWYCHRMGMKPKSVMISSTELPAKLKGKKYRDHTQLSGMDEDLEDGGMTGGYDMSPLQIDETDRDDGEDEDESMDRQQHDILEDADEDGAFMKGTTR